MRGHPRARARLLVVVAAALCALHALGPVAAAADGALRSDAAEARSAWQAAEERVDAALTAWEQAREALAEAEARETAAADRADTEIARLVERTRERDAAEETLRAAEDAAAAAETALIRAVAAYERAEERLLARREHLGLAAAQVYTTGDPQVRALSSLVRVLDETASVSEFLLAAERMTYVTVDARSQHDDATASALERGAEVAAAAEALDARRQAEEAARQARDAAQVALEEQRARRDEAVAAHDEAVALVEERAAAVEGADAAIAAAQAARTAALEALRGLGWVAGVPGGHGLVWPVDGRPGSGFGPRVHPITGERRRHLGVDVAAPTGQPVVAAAAGRVVHAGPRGGYGLTVLIDHGDGRTTLYAHLSEIGVRRGAEVAQAARIGAVGSTGLSTGPHLHFEVREHGVPRDPLGFFR